MPNKLQSKIVTASRMCLFVIGLCGIANTAQGLDLQGHRGARGLMPENSLAGFAKALDIGVTTLELDLALTRDYEVVVNHNPRFEPEITRDGNGAWLQRSSASIYSMSLVQAKTYDIGRLNPAGRYASRFPHQQSVDGSAIPTLHEVFDLVEVSGNRQVLFNIEVKINPLQPQLTATPQTFVRAVVAVLRDRQMGHRSILQSFDWRVLREVQRQAPEIVTAYLTVRQSWFDNLQPGSVGASPWLGGLDIDNFGGSAARAISTAGGAIWSPYHGEVDTTSIKQAQQLGLKVNVWTVNDIVRMRQLIAMGVDGIITDYPDRLRQVMQELDIPLPPRTPVK